MGSYSESGLGDDRDFIESAFPETASPPLPPPSLQNTSPWVFCASLLTILIALACFIVRIEPGIAWGIWQGPLLTPDTVGKPPMLMEGLVWITQYLPWGTPVARLNAASALMAALSCGVFTWLVSRLENGFWGACAGMMAAALLAATPLMTDAAAIAGPATLSLFLVLLSTALLLSCRDNLETSWRFYAAVAVTGLAIDNHASLGVIVAIPAFALIVFGSASWRTLRIACLSLAILLAVCLLPLGLALIRGESFGVFLTHALRQPYLNPFDAVPNMDSWWRMSKHLPPWLWFLAAIGIIVQLKRDSRQALLLLVLALITGPLLPALTNHAGTAFTLIDAQGPALTTIAIACWFSVAGVYALTRGVLKGKGQVAGRMLLLAILAGLNIKQIPLDYAGQPDQLARCVLENCPPRATLIAGTPAWASVLSVAQLSGKIRPDVGIVPVGWLTGNQDLSRIPQDAPYRRLRPQVLFPPNDAGNTWAREQPLLFSAFANAVDRDSRDALLRDLAIWEAVKTGYHQGPVCFIGVDSPWLERRAMVEGLVLTYPGLGRKPGAASANTAKEALEAFLGNCNQNSFCMLAPSVAEAIHSLMKPLVETAFMRSDWTATEALAEAWKHSGATPGAGELILTRCWAREGNKEKAQACAEQFLTATQKSASLEIARIAIEENLDAYGQDRAFMDLLEKERKDGVDYDARQTMASTLWMTDALDRLARGYDYVLEQFPNDLDALYQRAAVACQYGDLEQTRYLIERWMTLSNMPVDRVKERLDGDGRFVLLKSYNGPSPAPAMDR